MNWTKNKTSKGGPAAISFVVADAINHTQSLASSVTQSLNLCLAREVARDRGIAAICTKDFDDSKPFIPNLLGSGKESKPAGVDWASHEAILQQLAAAAVWNGVR